MMIAVSVSCSYLTPLEPSSLMVKKHGLAETEASVANKLSRRTFAATFFIAALVALEVDGIRLEDI